MHCELLVPALFQAATPVRLPALELLLARGRRAADDAPSPEHWLLDACDYDEEGLPAGALTLAATGQAPGEATWTRADPVHLRVLRDRAVVVPAQALAIGEDEAGALRASLNSHFAGRLELLAASPSAWCARLDAPLAFDASAPLDLTGQDVDAHLPQGEGARELHALLNEAQMLLHEHPVNAEREARGAPTVNSLWLWGPGRAPLELRTRWREIAATDEIARGTATLAGAAAAPLPKDAEGWLARLPAEGRHLAVLDALRVPLALGDAGAAQAELERLEAEWFAPLLAALRAWRIGMVTIHVPGTASFETIRGDLRRFWRRPRAIERHA